MDRHYTNRNGFIGVRPDGSLILASCSYYAGQSRDWVRKNLSTYDGGEPWSVFYKKGYRVVRCEVVPDGGRDGGLFRCPDEIFALFNEEATKPSGRQKAVEWMKGIMSQVRPGDVVIIPDAKTGDPVEMVKSRTMES